MQIQINHSDYPYFENLQQAIKNLEQWTNFKFELIINNNTIDIFIYSHDLDTIKAKEYIFSLNKEKTIIDNLKRSKQNAKRLISIDEIKIKIINEILEIAAKNNNIIEIEDKNSENNK